MGNYSVVVLDFETTGLSPDGGDRAIEIGAVLLQNNQIVARFQSLMNPEMRISSFIAEYTGITNKMLASAPPIAEAMGKFAKFMAGHHLVAHNASFDRRFLDAELLRINKLRQQEFACSMLLPVVFIPTHQVIDWRHWSDTKTSSPAASITGPWPMRR